jgi:hypothetical protein
MIEEWKDIPGYEGLYQVSNIGNVKSINYKKTGKEKLFNLNPNSQGYLMVCLSKNGKERSIKIHRLVAIAFLGHEPDNMNTVVNHIDNNKLNNNVDNLELVSQRYNSSCHKTDVGASWSKSNNKWLSNIRINKKTVNLGHFTNKQDALDQYQKALANIHLYNGDTKTFRKLIYQLHV